MANSKKLSIYLNIFIIFALIVLTIFSTFFKEYLPFFYLSERICSLVIMQLFSLLLLLGVVNSALSSKWKILSGIASIIVLMEAWLMK